MEKTAVITGIYQMVVVRFVVQMQSMPQSPVRIIDMDTP